MRKILFATILCVLMSVAFELPARDTYIRELSQAGQFLDMTVHSIMKDSVGYVWFGTAKGVERFDGVHVKHFPLGSNTGSPVRALVSDQRRRVIYAGNSEGLWRLGTPFKSFEKLKGINLKDVNAIVLTAPTRMLTGTNAGLYAVDLAKGKVSRLPLGPTRQMGNIAVKDIYYDRAHQTAWLATSKGIHKVSLYDGRSAEVFEYFPQGQSSQSFSKIIRIGDYLYLGTQDRGLMRFGLGDKQFSTYLDIGGNVVSDFATDGKGLLYVGGDGSGVTVIDTKRDAVVNRMVRQQGITNSLHSNSVYSVYIDDNGPLWVGYYQTGVDYTLFNSGAFSTFDESYYSTRGNPARSVLLDGSRILLGTLEGVVLLDREKKNVTQIRRPRLRSDMIISSALFRDRYYVGTYGGGINVIDRNGNLIPFTSSDVEFERGHIFSLTPDKEGTLWIGTSDGLYRYDGEKIISHFTYSNSRLPAGNIYEIFFDSKGKGWIGTENGLAIYDPSTRSIRTDLFPKGFFNRTNIRQIFEDRNHRLYFLPDKGNFYVSDLTMGIFSQVNDDALANRDVKAIAEDSTGHLWLATSNGMLRWNGRDTWDEYGFADGIPNPIFNSSRPVKDEKGNIWFGNSGGLVMLSSELMGPPAGAAPMKINEILVNGREFNGRTERMDNGEEHVWFPHHSSNVAFSLSAFSYTNPDQIHYEYRMDGVDDEWKTCGKDFQITYFSLPRGTHTLHIRLRGAQEDAATIVIHNPWEWWIWTLLVAGLVIVFLTVLLAVKHRRGSKNMELTRFPEEVEAEEEESEEDISDQKYKVRKLSEDECREIEKKLERIEKDERPFVRPDLRLSDLAEMAGVSSYKLSYYFSQYKHTTYYVYINALRIAEFKRLAHSKDAQRYTLTAFSEMAGFSSRASFFRYFKKIEGISPAEYLRKIEK